MFLGLQGHWTGVVVIDHCVVLTQPVSGLQGHRAGVVPDSHCERHRGPEAHSGRHTGADRAGAERGDGGPESAAQPAGHAVRPAGEERVATSSWNDRDGGRWFLLIGSHNKQDLNV